jgi:hypothetical protein
MHLYYRLSILRNTIKFNRIFLIIYHDRVQLWTKKIRNKDDTPEFANEFSHVEIQI